MGWCDCGDYYYCFQKGRGALIGNGRMWTVVGVVDIADVVVMGVLIVVVVAVLARMPKTDCVAW